MPGRVLVVDDDRSLTASLQQILSDEGFTVDTAATGREACTLLKWQQFAAVLLDLSLPDLDGMEVAELITKKDPDCAIIILTGQATIDSAIQAVRFGCYDYITKPCFPGQIVHALKRATENRFLKRELYASRRKYQRLAEATWEGIVVFSRESLHEVNSQFCKMFGVVEEDVIGYPIVKFIPRLELPAPTCPDIAEEITQVAEIDAVRGDGAIFPAEIRIKQVAEDGRPLWVAAIRDLTGRRLEEQSRIKLEEKLTYAMRMESIGLMVGSVAHDLNNILSSIVTFPELLLLDMPAHAKYRADIDRIKRAGQQAAAVVADLLTITRGSACKKEIRSLNDIARSYRESLDYTHQTRSFPETEILFDLDPRLGDVRISSVQVTKALINLVRNGAEAIDGRGAITISTRRRTLTESLKGLETIPPGRYEILSVADTGAGIAPQHLEHIFEPFYSKKQLGDSGTGLGLTVIMHTIRDHSGFIDLRSSTEGTIFDLYFPTCRGKGTIIDASMSLESLLGKGEKVLVVDDQENQRLITSSILKRLGYTPYAVENGEEAIRHIKQEPVDLLLLDMIMEPGMSGYETILEIRRLFPQQRAVVTSGYHNHPDRERIKELGVSRYLPKPLSLASLAQAIRQEISSC